MEEKGLYTAEQQTNSKASHPAGECDTTETSSADAKNDAMALFMNQIAMMRASGWRVEIYQDKARKMAYLAFPCAVWEQRGANLVLTEVEK